MPACPETGVVSVTINLEMNCDRCHHPEGSCSVLGRGLANQVGDRSDPKSDSKLRMKKALDHHCAPAPALGDHEWVKDTSNGSHA